MWAAGFGYTVEFVQSNQPAGTVVSTEPPAGTQLDPNSRNVTISASEGEPVLVPSEEDVTPEPDASESRSASTPAPAPAPAPQPASAPERGKSPQDES